MKKILMLAVFALSATLAGAQAKYIFLFIGDGMGFGAVTLTEDYLSSQSAATTGSGTLAFSTFPVAGFSTTYSTSSWVTCSSASGTAFACGSKTRNGRLGMNEDATQSFTSIACRLKEKGYKVGITTSVSIDHATPAAFYAHQPSRNMYYEIAQDLAKSGFDFFSGAGLLNPLGKDKKQENVLDLIEKSGYTVVRSLSACKASAAPKLLLLQPESKPQSAFPYVIDKTADDYTLASTTALAVEKLHGDKGFFLLVEGGKIDWASHDNDAGSMVREVVDMSDAVNVALDFYRKYPKQTLIVVTADHETGGLGVGSGEGGSIGAIRGLANQKASVDKLIRRMEEGAVSYSALKAWLAENMGVALTFDDEATLRDLFAQNAKSKPASDDTPCTLQNAGSMAKAIMRIVSAKSGGSYSTFGHTGTMVPVYAIGEGSELFGGKIDNTDIPKKIAKAAKVEWK
ncbi:MAG: alkaline phosphatase [Prevotellaceae bacterium]|jgi:alkaline phosphatase|nr:alkaline phosphatase [Prevotellaceae bacterium]